MQASLLKNHNVSTDESQTIKAPNIDLETAKENSAVKKLEFVAIKLLEMMEILDRMEKNSRVFVTNSIRNKKQSKDNSKTTKKYKNQMASLPNGK